MKRFLSLFLSIVLILSSLTLMSSAYWYTTDDKKTETSIIRILTTAQLQSPPMKGKKKFSPFRQPSPEKKLLPSAKSFAGTTKT